jgi:hypothetical protein
MTTPTPNAPVPTQRLRHEWIDLSPLYRVSNVGEPVRIGTDWDAAMDKAAAWGAAQAMQTFAPAPPPSDSEKTAVLTERERGNDPLRTMDARAWAAEFMKITGGTADEATMLAWFANAMMCGWDHHYWQSPEYEREVSNVFL